MRVDIERGLVAKTQIFVQGEPERLDLDTYLFGYNISKLLLYLLKLCYVKKLSYSGLMNLFSGIDYKVFMLIIRFLE